MFYTPTLIESLGMSTTKLLYNNTKTEKENMDALLIDSGVDPRHVSELVYNTVTDTPEGETNSIVNITVDPGSILAATNGPWVVAYGQRTYKKTGKENQKLNAHNYFLAESMADYVGTHSYVVSKKAFNKFYDLRKQNKIAADSWAVFISLGLRVFHSFPHVTDVNRSFESTIGHHAPQIAHLDDRKRQSYEVRQSTIPKEK